MCYTVGTGKAGRRSMEKWYKYTYTCDDVDSCDTLVEATSRGDQAHAWCPACGQPLNLISFEEATVENV
jgi:hypothetical protein